MDFFLWHRVNTLVYYRSVRVDDTRQYVSVTEAFRSVKTLHQLALLSDRENDEDEDDDLRRHTYWESKITHVTAIYAVVLCHRHLLGL
jgi:hypothetical protein